MLMLRKLLPLLLIALVVPLKAQDTVYVRQTLEELTSQRMLGRGYSYRGDSIAAAFIRQELRRLHIQPLGDDYYQRYTFSVSSMEGPLSVSINGAALKAYDQFRVPAWSASTWGTYKVLSIDPQTLMDGEKLQQVLKKHNELLSDQFVLVDATSFKPKDEAEQRRFDDCLKSMRVRNPFGSRGIILAVKQLSTYSPAHTDSRHDYAFVELLASALPKKVKSITCSIFTQFHPSYATQNVCGIVPGEVDTMVVYTAHYDHLGTMGDSVIFYGAHDNGIGVATVLDLARMAVADKPHYTQVFCFFSGEEAGLKGSQYMSEHPLFDFSKVRILINIDMFCGGDEGLMVFNAKASETQPFVERIVTLNNVLQVVPEIRLRENRPNSDHYYLSRKMPALFFLTMGQRYGGYHDPQDTCERCGLENYLNYITLITSLAL